MGIFRNLQSDIATRLRESVELGTAELQVPVYEEDRHDIDAEVLKALSKVGVGVAVTTPGIRTGDLGEGDVEATVIIEITENVLVNRGPSGTQRTWLTIGESCFAQLNRWAPPGGWSPMEFVSFEQVAPGRPILANLTLTTRALLV